MDQHLRPIERRVLAMRDAGLSNDEIAGRIKRSPEHVERVVGWAAIPRSKPPTRRTPRAIERRVLAMRAAGLDHATIAAKFKKTPRGIRRIEGLAHFRLANDLLVREETT